MESTIVTGELLTSQIEFTWKIRQLSHLFKGTQTVQQPIIVSPYFTILVKSTNSARGESYHNLQLFLKTRKNPNSSDCTLYLFIEFLCITNNVKVLSQICLLDKFGKKVEAQYLSAVFSPKDPISWGVSLPTLNSLLDNQNNFLNNDILTISCKIIMVVSCSDNIFNASVDALSDDYESIFLSETFSDVTFKIGTKYIKAHKNILSSRSKVFKAMFQHDMLENSQNVVEIVDIGYDIMLELLRFIYTGKVKNLEGTVKLLVIAADKYDLYILKSICENCLLDILNIEEACEILSIASLYNCRTLKQQTMEYVIKNLKMIVETAGYKRLSDTRSFLLSEILSNVAKQLNN